MSRPDGMSWFKYWLKPHPGAVYSLRTVSLRTGRSVRRGYIGQTRRAVAERVEEHRKGSRYGKPAQPWASCIEGYETMWSSHSCYQLRLNWEEFWRISLYRPVYNIQFNRWRPNRRRVIPCYIKGTGRNLSYEPPRVAATGAVRQHVDRRGQRTRAPRRVAATPARMGAEGGRQGRRAASDRRQRHPAGSAGRR